MLSFARAGVIALAAVSAQAAQCPLSSSGGCGKNLPSGAHNGDTKSYTIDIDGVTRNYLIHIPENYDINTPVPLILSFHGRGKDASFQEELSQFSNSTYNPNAFAVYPNGLANSAGTRQWLGDPTTTVKTNNDFEFTTQLISHIEGRYCIDSSKVYASGKSNGGGFTFLLACNETTSAQIAAFAGASAAIYTQFTQTCTPARIPLPVLEFHGLQDRTIFYNGSSPRGETVDLPDYMNEWAARDGFDPAQNTTENACAGTKFPTATHFSWGDGVVQHYQISNIGHTWPDPFPNADDGKQTCVDGTAVMMNFFEQFSLPN